ncbi:MAG: TSUP family transporter [Alicyclobacillus herbarius]|uniref:TSUP family transporter n=1 Tax=Alicyclobacillus herbarius TaxID=122960 RepID=UPI00040432A3|nr:TSUP family transporter [Alicyclobacillus herbarius]MCL6633436.1 TSUP family transporter [Alicyclobacillus herbarius]
MNLVKAGFSLGLHGLNKGDLCVDHLHLTIGLISFLFVAGFIASFIDSTVGGGGLVTLPSLLLAGLPPALALGTNKLAGTMSSLTSTLSYLRSGKVDFRLTRWLFPLSLAGSVLGADLARHLPSAFLKPLVVVLLIAVTVYTLVKKDFGLRKERRTLTPQLILAAAALALIIGFYDGFFGPGTGSFLIFVFLFLGYDYVEASGNAKVLNFGSNIGALATFAGLHAVDWRIGLIMGVGMVLGAVAGSQMAIRKGAAYVRPIFIVVTVILIGKQVWSWL